MSAKHTAPCYAVIKRGKHSGITTHSLHGTYDEARRVADAENAIGFTDAQFSVQLQTAAALDRTPKAEGTP